jgi:uncharacterized protein (DUF1810 family)
MEDPFDLQRFVTAQDRGGAFDAALDELRRGRKVSHWMWFVFPQIAGLGSSQTARHFAISGLDEARAYLDHPLLGARLIEAAAVTAAIEGRTADEVFGATDALKLRSSMTLFARARPGEPTFERVLRRFFGGEADPETDRRI